MSATARLELAIELDSDPITGSVSSANQNAQPFTGWIELAAAIEAARSPGHACEARRPEAEAWRNSGVGPWCEGRGGVVGYPPSH